MKRGDILLAFLVFGLVIVLFNRINDNNTSPEPLTESPSGYDPMAVSNYVGFYNRFLNEASQDFVSRYSELNFYDAKKLGLVNVKYFLALKRNSENEVSQYGENLFSKININDWKNVYETDWVVILENKFFNQRVSLDTGTSEIMKYSPNEVVVNYFANTNGELSLLDTNYPGWKAYVNGDEVKIKDYMEVYRKVEVLKGSGRVEFKYQPESFYLGLKITTIAFLGWIMVYKFTKQ